VRKLHKLMKQIQNYIKGHIMKKQTASDNREEKAKATILAKHENLICANMLRIIAQQK